MSSERKNNSEKTVTMDVRTGRIKGHHLSDIVLIILLLDAMEMSPHHVNFSRTHKINVPELQTIPDFLLSLQVLRSIIKIYYMRFKTVKTDFVFAVFVLMLTKQ